MATLPKDRLYVSGLPSATKEADVVALFSKIDKVTDIHIGINPWDGSCRGYVHATCSSEQAAQRCLRALQNSNYQGCTLSVEVAKPRYYEMQKEKQLHYNAKLNGKTPPLLERKPYADRPRKEQHAIPSATKVSPAESSSSSSDSSSDSDSPKQNAPAPQPKIVKRKVIVKKIIKRPGGAVVTVEKTGELEPPASAAVVVASSAASPQRDPPTVTAVTHATPARSEPEESTIPPPESTSEPPKKKVKIIKKVVKRPAAPATSETSNQASPTVEVPAAP
eukprot:EG_transcript_23533